MLTPFLDSKLFIYFKLLSCSSHPSAPYLSQRRYICALTYLQLQNKAAVPPAQVPSWSAQFELSLVWS